MDINTSFIFCSTTQENTFCFSFFFIWNVMIYLERVWILCYTWDSSWPFSVMVAAARSLDNKSLLREGSKWSFIPWWPPFLWYVFNIATEELFRKLLLFQIKNKIQTSIWLVLMLCIHSWRSFPLLSLPLSLKHFLYASHGSGPFIHTLYLLFFIWNVCSYRAFLLDRN